MSIVYSVACLKYDGMSSVYILKAHKIQGGVGLIGRTCIHVQWLELSKWVLAQKDCLFELHVGFSRLEELCAIRKLFLKCLNQVRSSKYKNSSWILSTIAWH